jgi:hypothetical protein
MTTAEEIALAEHLASLVISHTTSGVANAWSAALDDMSAFVCVDDITDEIEDGAWCIVEASGIDAHHH